MSSNSYEPLKKFVDMVKFQKCLLTYNPYDHVRTKNEWETINKNIRN